MPVLSKVAFALVGAAFQADAIVLRKEAILNVDDSSGDLRAAEEKSLLRKNKDGSFTKEKDQLSTNYNFNGDFKINNRPLLLEQPSSSVSHNYGRSVWEGGIVMAKFLEKQVGEGGELKKGSRGLEFGSGTGVGGLSLALAGGHVILTDKKDVNGESLPTEINLKKNLDTIKEADGAAEFKSLDWAHLPDDAASFLGDKPDVVFGSDLFGSWSTDPEGPSGCPHCGRLADAFGWAHKYSDKAKMYLSYTKRETSALDTFTKELNRNGLTITKKEDAEGANGGNIFLLYIGKK